MRIIVVSEMGRVMQRTHLGNLAPGQKAVVRALTQAAAPFRRKLLAMGLTPGCTLEVVRVAPLGDPLELSLRGFSLCLRRAEAAAIEVEVLA